MTICATIIVGNNEAIVEDAVRSVVDWVDAILLIDTGIADRSREEVAAIAGDKLVVKTFSWCNHFGAVRNFALLQATQLGHSIAITCDTDERLDFYGFVDREAFDRYLDSHPELMAWHVRVADQSYMKERVFRLPLVGEAGWKGETHEYFWGYPHYQVGILNEVRFTELPKTSEQLEHKLQRDLQMLSQTTQREPLNVRWWFYLAQTHLSLQQNEEALLAFRKCLSCPGEHGEQQAGAAYYGACVAIQLNRHLEALELCMVGLGKDNRWPELLWTAGLCCFYLNRFEEAIAWSRLAICAGHDSGIELGKHRWISRNLVGWYEGPCDVLRHAYHRLTDDTNRIEADRCYETAMKKRLSLNFTHQLPKATGA